MEEGGPCEGNPNIYKVESKKMPLLLSWLADMTSWFIGMVRQ